MKWVLRWGYEMAAKPTRPGIYRLKAGGFFVRTRVTDALGKRLEITAALHTAKTAAEAQQGLDRLRADARAEARGEVPAKQTWTNFALSRLKERMSRGDVASEATVERWQEAIPLFDAEWGHIDVRSVTREHHDRWLNTKVTSWMTEGRTVMRKRRVDGELVMVPFTTRLKPSYVNGWLRVLRAICHAAKVKFKLPHSSFDGVEFFKEGRHYTREQPNALPPNMLATFMDIAYRKHRPHFAMILLGFVTGLRPSSLRPLRRSGAESDLDWNTGLLQVRRSNARRQIVMDKTKTGRDNEIALPPVVLDVLRAHVARLHGAQLTSALLFPSRTGALRARSVLAKPFASIAAEMGLAFRLTPRGMRRTFNDAARLAGIHDVVTRAISGHQTEAMQVHYSTAQVEEQRSAIARIAGEVGGKKGETCSPLTGQPCETQ